MVWQRILRRIASNTQQRKLRQRRLGVERMERRMLLATDLGAISGSVFVDQDADGTSTGDPAVLVDASGDLVAPGTPGAQGIQVQLFTDTNNDTVFDSGDQLIGTDITDLDGSYRFDRLTEGTYFLVQQSVPQLNTPASVTAQVSAANAMGVLTQTIDDYTTTDQTVSAGANATSTDSAGATEAIGGARDIQVSNTAASGQLTVLIDSGNDTLSVGSLGDAVGTVLIQYDGSDSSINLDPSGLGGVSLAGGAPGDAVAVGDGLILLSRAESAGDQMFVTVHSNAGNSSTATVNLPQDNTTLTEIFVPFSSFVTSSGTGADFNDVGAIETSISLSANNDAFVSIVETRRAGVVETSIANIQPLTLGGEVFFDNADGAQNNGTRQSNEPGATGVAVQLFKLDTDRAVDPVADMPFFLTSTTTGANGAYSFPGLDPGFYATVIPSNQFSTGAVLGGFANSTGNGSAPDPDNDTDDDDNGTTLASGDVVSGTITLTSNTEPINDDDTDPNTNTTLDFGVFPQINLTITKTLNVAASNLASDGNAVFDIVVQNAGPRPATDVRIEDVIPNGLVFTGTANAPAGTTTNVSGSTVELLIGDLGVGNQVSFQILTDIAANQTSDITNTIAVTANEVETDPTDNTDTADLDLPSADLVISKTDLTDPVNAGNTLTYEITVTNNGPDNAEGVIVVDPLPAGVVFRSGSIGGQANLVNFDATTGQVTGTIGVLNNGASSVVTITVDVDTNAVSPLNNTASVSSTPNSDPNPDNNTTAEDTTVEREVDVQVEKTVTGDPVAGQDVTYTVLVTNNGPSEARGISVTDTLDSNLQFVAGSFDPGTSGTSLTPAGSSLTFDVGTLDAAATASFSFDVTIDAGASGTIPNTANVTTTDNDTVAANNTSTVNIDVEQRVDLILTKTVDLTTAVPGQDQLVYTFTVSHDTDSVSDATNVQVTDTLPAGLTGQVISAPTATSQGFDTATGTITVDFASLPIGSTETFTVTVDVAQDATGDAAGNIVNPASVSSAGTELDLTNNADDATTALTPDFDLVVTKSVDDPTPGPSGTVVYTIGVENEGPSAASGVILSDPVPNGLTFVSGSFNGVNATNNNGTITFPAFDLNSGQSLSGTLTFDVAVSDGTITNTASVPDQSADGENDVTNNAASADITIQPETDVTIAKTVDVTDAQVGSNLVYTVTVSNNGPSPATNVQVVDTLPAGVNFVSGTGPNGETLTASGSQVTVNGGDLADQGTFSFTINGTITAGASATLTNTAVVTTDTNETNTNNNSATAVTNVDPVTSTIAGTVYIDSNNNGIQDAGEDGIANVEIVLSGTDSLGNTVNRTATTDANGNYQFTALAAGTYTVTETQPGGFRDGIETAGSGATAAVADNVFTQLGLAADTDAVNFDFGELQEALSKRRFLAST